MHHSEQEFVIRGRQVRGICWPTSNRNAPTASTGLNPPCVSSMVLLSAEEDRFGPDPQLRLPDLVEKADVNALGRAVGVTVKARSASQDTRMILRW